MPDVLSPAASEVERREANRRLRRVATAAGLWALLASGRLDPRRRRRLAMLRLHESIPAAQALGRALASGRLDPAAWQPRFAAWLRVEHRAATLALLGSPGTTRGEPLDLTEPQEADLERGSRLQLGYLARFRSQVESGQAPLDGRIVTRSTLYARAAWGVAWGVVRADAGRVAAAPADPLHPFPFASPGLTSTPYPRGVRTGGRLLERRVLGDAHHCRDCPELADRGWQPYGTLPPIGATTCGPFCLCHFEYRTFTPAPSPGPGPGPGPRPKPTATPKPPAPRFELSGYSKSRGDVPVRVDLARLLADAGHELQQGMRPASLPVLRAEIAASGVVHAPRVGLAKGGVATILDGRHRLRLLAEMGLRRITVAVDPEEVRGIRARYGRR